MRHDAQVLTDEDDTWELRPLPRATDSPEIIHASAPTRGFPSQFPVSPEITLESQPSPVFHSEAPESPDTIHPSPVLPFRDHLVDCQKFRVKQNSWILRLQWEEGTVVFFKRSIGDFTDSFWSRARKKLKVSHCGSPGPRYSYLVFFGDA